MPLEILLAEDEPAELLALGDALEDEGHMVVRAADGNKAHALLASEPFDLLITDVRMPGRSGYALAREAMSQQPPVAVVLMTAFGEVEQAVEMLKAGVRDYLSKPFREEELLTRVAALEQELGARPEGPGGPVAASPPMRQTMALARRLARTNTTVLLSGETGVGKEVVARYIHRASNRSEGPFIAANCAAIPAELIESEMFGHVKGAFTGATAPRDGWIRAADGGTLLLDEVGDLSGAAQAKLLRALETRTVQPVGSDKTIASDFRLLAATNHSLATDTQSGAFRMDLLYRIASFELKVPPLRDRPEDIGPLVGHFLSDLGEKVEEVPQGIGARALSLLASYRWPGNVRELKNAVEYSAVLAGTASIQPEHLPPSIAGGDDEDNPLDLRQAIEALQARHIRAALAISGGKKARAAELLGVSRKHLWELTRRHAIELPPEDVTSG